MVGVSLVSLCMMGALVWKIGGSDLLKQLRADYFMSQAEAAFAEGNWEKSSRLGASAYFLEGERADAALLVARAHLKRRSPATVDWWRRGLSVSAQPVKELQELTELMLDGGQYDAALEFIHRLLQVDPGGMETQQLWMRALEAMKRYTDYMEVTKTVMNDGESNWSLHHRFIDLQRGLGGEEGKEVALRHLASLLDSEGAHSLEAASQLLRLEDVPEGLALRAARALVNRSDSPATVVEAQLALSRLAVQEEEIALRSYLAYLEKQENEELNEACRLVLSLRRPEWLLKGIDYIEYLNRGGAEELYLEACLAHEAFTELLGLTEGEFVERRGSKALHHYYRARALNALGDLEEAQASLNLAVEIVEAEEIPGLEARLFRDGNWDVLQTLYNRLQREHPGDWRYFQQALTVEYYRSDTAGIERLLEEFDGRSLSRQPVAEGFRLYLDMLTKGWTPAIHQALEELVAKYPETFDFRLLLGLSYYLSGERGFAQGFVEGMPELGESSPRFLRVCAAVLRASSISLIRFEEWTSLLPRERYLLALAGAIPEQFAGQVDVPLGGEARRGD